MIHIALISYVGRRFGFERVKGVVRVTGYGLCIAGAVSVFGMHKARAAINESGRAVGEDLLAVAPLLKDATSFRVNNQMIHFGETRSLEGTASILDKFESACQTGEGGGAPVWNGVPSQNDVTAAKGLGDKMPVLRQETATGGYVACLVPEKNGTTETVLAAFDRYMKHGGAFNVGKLRYATVKTDATGSNVVSVWTEEGFDLGAFIPDGNKDKPGNDPPTMKRPNDAVRMLSGEVEALPYKVYLYEAHQSPKAAIDDYDKTMIANDWVAISSPQMQIVPHEGFEVRAYMKDGFIGYVTAGTSTVGTTLIGVGETSKVPTQHAAVVEESF